ncbi:MAG: TetR/AcrR family transcriptional regulator [Nocardioidaceae bacterium]|nr:MAG: TetR/AcrR family transcriptional regulator [Nocardioidaceae bacterium]
MSEHPNDGPARPRTSPRRRPGRERLLATADELLYRDGLSAAGIDRIIKEAGVVKATLYANFKSKEELIDAYLEARHQQAFAAIETIAAAGGSITEQVDLIFDHLAALTAEEAFRGCVFVVAAAEMPDEGRPAMRWARAHKRATVDCFQRMFANSGLRDASSFAEQITILYDGALITSVMRPESNAIAHARAAAHALIEAGRR